MRIERDTLGEVQVPDDALYGAQTQRAVENYPISGLREHPLFIRAFVCLKKAAALANLELDAPLGTIKLDENRQAIMDNFLQQIVEDQNGDGKNDNWLVKNLEKFPDNEMVIFNRWGSEVHKQKSYKNDWAAKGLEQGTYFYKVRVKLCDGVYKEYTGYVTIFR